MAYIRSQNCSIWKASSAASPVGAYAQVGQVTSISGPDGNIPEIDVTHLGSSGKEFIAGLADWGSVTCEVIADPATLSTLHEEIFNDFLAGTQSNIQVRLSDSPATSLTMAAYPNQFSFSLGVDEAVRATIGFKVTGAPTLLTP